MKYDQPCFVPFDIRHRFRGVDAFGYLPPLEPPEEKPPIKFLIKDEEDTLKAEILRVKAMVLYLQKKINEHTDKKKHSKY